MVTQLPQKPHLLKIIPPLENSIVIKGDDIAWNNPWHYHPEVELLYCIKGKGTNFIGNSIRKIEEGEILLLGKNLPHTRQRDRGYYEANIGEQPESIVIQFREDFLGDGFFMLKEFVHVRALLQLAKVGLKFVGNTQLIIAQKLENLKKLNPTAAVLELLAILDTLARSEEYIQLNALNYESDVHEKASQKINKVYHYTIEHFREPISLEQVASLTSHSPAAFCRYFKTRTRKSYFQYLTEIRIAYACELLMEGDLDVTRVCYASGFNNLSNFHKQFKKVMRITPSEYRYQSLKKIPQRLSVPIYARKN
jgi:AraC-like DNA-binding protein